MTTTDQTTPTIDPAVAAEALAGPWQAVLVECGDITTIEDLGGNWFDDDQADAVRILIVRRTAIPVGDSASGAWLPDTWTSGDRAVEFEHFETFDEIAARWVQAQAMVAGLNGAAEATR